MLQPLNTAAVVSLNNSLSPPSNKQVPAKNEKGEGGNPVLHQYPILGE